MLQDKQYHTFRRGHLPHIQPKDGTFFITFNLHLRFDNDFYVMLAEKKAELTEKLANITNTYQRNLILGKKMFAFRDSYFDLMQGNHNLLQINECAQLVADEIQYHDKRMYDLLAFTIMPNHVHILIKPLRDVSDNCYTLPNIMKCIKGRSSRLVNQVLLRTGKLWQREYFDHYVRNEEELRNIVRYIVMNPVKANLVQEPRKWKWTWVAQEFMCILDDDYIREDCWPEPWL